MLAGACLRARLLLQRICWRPAPLLLAILSYVVSPAARLEFGLSLICSLLPISLLLLLMAVGSWLLPAAWVICQCLRDDNQFA
jgi:hypothetical protein